jgi:hypothetical protein
VDNGSEASALKLARPPCRKGELPDGSGPGQVDVAATTGNAGLDSRAMTVAAVVVHARPSQVVGVRLLDHAATSQRGNGPDPVHKDSPDSTGESVAAAEATCPGGGADKQVASSEPPMSTRELDRLWGWGLHEDELLVNRMSVSLLAQSILLVAAVGILTAANAGMADRIVEIVLDIVGLTITVSLWHVFTLHAAHIKILSDEQKNLEPRDALYARVHSQMAESRERSWVQRHIFGRTRGTNLDRSAPLGSGY